MTGKSSTGPHTTRVIRFDDKSTVVCDADHAWWSFTGPQADREIVMTTDAVARHLNAPGHTNMRRGLRIPVAEPLRQPAVDLPIDPYVLGVWLGDGAASNNRITKGDKELFGIMQSDGHELGKLHVDRRSDCITRAVLGLYTGLRESNLLNNKHVPAEYLRASEPQRLAIVRGLMDTDGTWNTARNTAVFSTTDKGLALAIEELLLSLAQRPHVVEFMAHGFGKYVTAYHVEFTPADMMPFRLTRKRDKCLSGLVNKNITRSRRRIVKSVEPGPDTPTVAIAVDSPDGTYLCTERMIPTCGMDYSLKEQSL